MVLTTAKSVHFVTTRTTARAAGIFGTAGMTKLMFRLVPSTYGSAAGPLPSNCMSVASAAQHNECGFVLLDKSLAFTLNDADISIGSHCKASSGIWMPEHGDLSNADVDELTHHLQNEALSLKEGSSNADDDSSICRSEQPEGFESSCVEALATGSRLMLGHSEKAVVSFSECGSSVADSAECSRECGALDYLSLAINDKAHDSFRMLYCSEVRVTRQVSAGIAKVIDCFEGKYSNWGWKAVRRAGDCKAESESHDKACNKCLLDRVQEYLDNFPSQVIGGEDPFYLPIPAEVLQSDAARPKFQAMCEVLAEGSRLLRARGM